MKKAAPPTAATARMPTMITEAITIDTHVGSLFALIPTIYGMLLDRVRQAARFVRRGGVVVAVAERDRGAQLFAPRGRFSRLHCELAELEVRAPVDPFAPLGAKRLLQVGVGVGG